MLFIFIMLLFGLSYCSLLYSQEKNDVETHTSRSSFYLELGGNGIIYSINYDHMLTEKGRFSTHGRIGLSGWPQNGHSMIYAIPLEVNELIGGGKHHFEMGFGFTTFIAKTYYDPAKGNEEEFITEFVPMITERVGYRFQKADGGFLFRIGLVLHNLLSFRQLFPWGGISIGYTLKAKN